MAPEIPYRVVGELGSCDVGTVWSAVDEETGLPVTVAVLNAQAAGDQRWRDAFAGHAGTAHAGADFTAAVPWVAFDGAEEPGAERVFASLGRTYTPAPAFGTPVSGSVSETSMEMGDDPFGLGGGAPRRPYFGAGAEDPFGGSPTAARKPGNRLWIGIAAGVAVLLVGVGVVVGVTRLGGDSPAPAEAAGPVPSPVPASTSAEAASLSPGSMNATASAGTVTPSTAASTAGAPAAGGAGPAPAGNAPAAGGDAAPADFTVPARSVRPGIEPPYTGTWPAGWPEYGSGDPTKLYTLPGLGFDVRMPSNWKCKQSGAGHVCGYVENGALVAGGEIIARDCGSPCDDARRTALRATEDAFGANWRFAGKNITIAETEKLNGTSGYGIVMIGYYRAGSADRQVVMRMTADVAWNDEFRRIAAGIRDTTGI
ncbi:hypothetical protein J2S43_007508 [Catenuloplanes nepalensis]|uniref:Uncharacterized protein n=1 Tax=Catenuloplanes nepalensis TaxID=587533 RepID=A0ABT9N6V8_9ACTN|nr:hypothetical protein [Catenuloplanes nepalensis]MDP9798996.1 hypothetical protein [Catenuloplanes nepalensis]